MLWRGPFQSLCSAVSNGICITQAPDVSSIQPLAWQNVTAPEMLFDLIRPDDDIPVGDVQPDVASAAIEAAKAAAAAAAQKAINEQQMQVNTHLLSPIQQTHSAHMQPEHATAVFECLIGLLPRI